MPIRVLPTPVVSPAVEEARAVPSVAVLHQITTGNSLSAALLASYGSNVL
jgi:hypothetical protein